MIFVYAIIPISCVAAVLSVGGSGISLALCVGIPLVLSLFPIKARFRFIDLLLIPIFLFATALHAYSVYSACIIGLDSLVAGILSVACIIIAAITAYKGKGAEYASTPIFFIAFILALYTFFVSLDGNTRILDVYPSRADIITSIVCPFSLCLAIPRVNDIARYDSLIGYTLGLFVSAVFIICSGAETEFGFICVPLAIISSALEAKAAIRCILSLKRE